MTSHRSDLRVGLIAALILASAACRPAPPASPTAVAHATASPLPRATTSTADWQEVALPADGGRARALGVVADAEGFVIYGSVGAQAAVWLSTDAFTWELMALPGNEGIPARGAASRTATVLIGGGSTSRCAHPSGDFLWRREAGLPEWRAVPFDRSLFCAGGSPAIAARADLFMVAGMGTGDQPFAWRSADGQTWSDASLGIPSDLPPWALAATPREFVELGRGSRTDVRVTSGDAPWSAVEAPPVPPAFSDGGPGAEPIALVDTAAGLLAAYSSDDGRSISTWRRSTEGEWSGVSIVGIAAGGGITDATAMLGAAFLFVRGSGGQPASLVTSPDLVRWTQLPVAGLDQIRGVATYDERTVVVGWELDEAGDEERSVVKILDGVPAP